MAALTASTSFASKTLRASSLRRSAVVALPKARSVVVSASADRPLWFPGNPAPAHLDGTMAGDFGFDPLGLAVDPESKKWNQAAELMHGRWAMLAVAGILFTAVGAEAGGNFPQWWEAGKQASINPPPGAFPISFGTNAFVSFLLMHFVETKRGYDMRNSGSQGDGSFFGVTDALKGKEGTAHPGGAWFDPFGMSQGPNFAKYKENEVKNGRLAMLALIGFVAQHEATGKGPVANLMAHIADPYHVTFATNGVSLPFRG
jgi:hypothetical protein